MSSRTKMTFKAGELAAALQKHDHVVSTLRADVHHKVQQQIVHDLLIELRTLSPKVTYAALMEAMAPMPFKRIQKEIAA
eukprot:1846437-Amphidinium_carterae.1